MDSITDAKKEWRARLRAGRSALSESRITDGSSRITVVAATLALGPTVAAYIPVGREPGGSGLIDALAARARVLLPVTPVEPGPLDWAEYDGALAEGAYRLLEPTGPRLGPDAVLRATTVLLPALGVSRTGVRIGRGAGYYDRSLGAFTGRRVAVVYDDEVVDSLPAEPTDVPVDAALTPSGLIEFSVAP